MVLPMPCPTSSRFGLWRVRVIASATSEVRRLSMEPSRARISAGCTARASSPGASSGRCRLGRPVGTSPMTGVSLSHSTLSAVPATSAASAGGMYFRSCAGHKTPTASVTSAMVNALKFRSAMVSGQARTASSGPPVRTGAPMNGMGLQQDDDHTDARHEARYHRVRRIGDKPANPHQAERDLDQPGHHHDGEGLGEALGVGGDNHRHGHGHGARRAEIWDFVPPNTAAKNPTAIAP